MRVLVDPKIDPKAAHGFLAEIYIYGKKEIYIGDNHTPVVNS